MTGDPSRPAWHEKRMEEVIRFVEGLDIRGLRVLRDVAVELLQGLVRKLH